MIEHVNVNSDSDLDLDLDSHSILSEYSIIDPVDLGSSRKRKRTRTEDNYISINEPKTLLTIRESTHSNLPSQQ